MKIGIVAKVTNGYYGISAPYINFANRLSLYLTEEPASLDVIGPHDFRDVDLVLLPGGSDVNTLRYGEQPHVLTGKPDPMLEYFDVETLPKYIENGTPVFGICRGFQTLLVMMGYKMIQHLDGHPTNDWEYRRGEEVHDMDIVEIGASAHSMGASKSIRTNSLHHQGVLYERKNGVNPVASSTISSSDHRQIMEAFVSDNIAGVQYHPEEMAGKPAELYAFQIIRHIFSNKTIKNEAL